MTQLFWAVTAAGVVAVVAVVWGVARFWRRRRQQWEDAAPMLGLALSEGPPLHERFANLDYFQQGRARRTRVLLEGKDWRGRLLLGDHVYSIGSGQNRSKRRHTVCVVQDPGLALPHFSLRREFGLIDRIAELFGGQDLDFEEDREFSRTFRLQGSDEAGVRSLFSGAVRHFLLHTAGSGVVVEGRDDILLVHVGRLVRPAEAATLLRMTQELAQLLRG